MMIALSPAIYAHNVFNDKPLEAPNTRLLGCISWLLIACAIIQIPELAHNFEDGLVRLILDSDAGKDAYAESIENVSAGGKSINNLPAIIFNTISDIGVFLFFYYLRHPHENKWKMIGLGICLIVSVLRPIMHGQRGPVIAALLTAIMCYFLFERFYSKRLSHRIRLVGVMAIFIVFIPIGAITFSRFGSSEQGVGGYLSWYIGQGSLYFNNYALDDGGIRYGDRTANIFKRIIWSDTPANFVERRAKYGHLTVDDEIFTTFVGDFCIDYGPFVAFLIFVIFNVWGLSTIAIRDGTIKIHQLYLVYFTLCISVQGGMTLFAYSDTANLRIVTFILLYAYLRYHDKLLTIYPVKIKKNEIYTQDI